MWQNLRTAVRGKNLDFLSRARWDSKMEILTPISSPDSAVPGYCLGADVGERRVKVVAFAVGVAVRRRLRMMRPGTVGG